MKKLTQFQSFNFGAFAKDKQFMIQSIKWNDKKGCVSLDVIITEDNTDYGDDSVSNIFEKFKVHLIKDTDEDDVEKYHAIHSLTLNCFRLNIKNMFLLMKADL